MEFADNQRSGINVQLTQQQFEDLSLISYCPLKDLVDDEQNSIWIYPDPKDRYDDRIENDYILSLKKIKGAGNYSISTYNIMGFIGCGKTQVNIRSRFSSGKNDWFMQYLLQKVFSINLFDLKHSYNELGALDIAPLLLPYFLQKALRQGVYREYARFQYNDDRVKGAIDVNAHIKNNYPFKNGKISYTTREFTFDNSVTELVRHTIEYLKSTQRYSGTLFSSPEMVSCVRQIVSATPSYRKRDLRKIMAANLKPKIHPYYSEYRPLQKLCMQILNRHKIGYGENNEQIYGVIFDGAWLWEEYLASVIKGKIEGIRHPKNKASHRNKDEKAVHAFVGDNRGYPRYPDFIYPNFFVADAKYKNMKDTGVINIQRDDLNQIITYMHILNLDKGIFISPMQATKVMDPSTGIHIDDAVIWKDYFNYVGTLNGKGGEIIVITTCIPQCTEKDTFESFSKQMEVMENCLVSTLKNIAENKHRHLTLATPNME